MVGHGHGPRPGRRRVVGGLLAIGASSLLLACEPRIRLPSSAPTPSSARKPQPLVHKAPPAEPGIRFGVDFGRVLRLEGVTVDQETLLRESELRLWFYWLAVAASQEDFRSSAQLVGEQGRVAAREDDQIGGRKRVLSRWRPGERRVDEMRIRIARRAPLGEHGLAVGVLRADNQTHVPITGRPGDLALWNEDAVLVGTVEIVAG